jgi:hypothetical protein
MSIALTSPESRPALTEARLSGIVIDLPRRACELHVQLGYVSNGQFTVVRTQPVQFADQPESGNQFTALVQAVPEFRDLRRALESYLHANGYFIGTVS